MIDFSKYPELKQDFIQVEKYLDSAAYFFGYKNFDDYMQSRVSIKHDIDVLLVAELIQKTTLEERRVMLKRLQSQMSFFRKTIIWVGIMFLSGIALLGVLAMMIMLNIN